MRLSFVNVENGIYASGFRKMATVARELEPSTEVLYLVPANASSPLMLSLRPGTLGAGFSDDEIDTIAARLSRADMVCYSSMTLFAGIVRRLIRSVRRLNPSAVQVWGGVHAIVDPQDAILEADAVCTGEGEAAFREYWTAFREGRDFTTTMNFWFRSGERIVRNGFRPLHTGAEMDRLPLPLYAEEESIYRRGRGFTPLGTGDYLRFNSLRYMVVWALGCPYRCTYCSNSRFIENDRGYAHLRHPSVDTLLREVRTAIAKHPHISNITFVDDSFIALPMPVLEEFAGKWKAKIGLPFFVAGVIPTAVTAEKLALLIDAGMNRIRMGIQSGSERILKFYKRPYTPARLEESLRTIARFSRHMMPPAYDMILDNPLETREDVVATLDLLHRAPRPYHLFVYGLRVIPGTRMERDFNHLGVTHKGIDEGYGTPEPTLANLLVYLLVIVRLPGWMYRALVRRVRPYGEPQSRWPMTLALVRTVYLLKRALYYLRYMDFSVTGGRFGWLLWRLGLIRWWQKRLQRRRARLPVPPATG